jgi:hypothetical protein
LAPLALLALALPSPAAGGEWRSNTYIAGQGEANDVRVVFDGATYTVTDSAGMTVVHGGFHPATATSVSCTYDAMVLDASRNASRYPIGFLLTPLTRGSDGAADRFSYQGPPAPPHSYLRTGVAVTAGGSSADITGSPGDDALISAGAGPGRVDGGDGSDYLEGGSTGQDTLSGGNGGDVMARMKVLRFPGRRATQRAFEIRGGCLTPISPWRGMFLHTGG